MSAASILQVMGLGVQHGEEVILFADGPDASSVLDELVAMLATDLETV